MRRGARQEGLRRRSAPDRLIRARRYMIVYSSSLPVDDAVHAGGRKWKWDGTKWTLYSEGAVNGIQFEAEIPVYRKLAPGDNNPNEEIKVTHFFDMNDLTQLNE